MVRLVAIPSPVRKDRSSTDMKADPRSECTYAGIPKMENKWVRHLITVVVVISRQG